MNLENAPRSSYLFASRTLDISQVLTAYAITFGWALVGSLSVAIGVFLALKLFSWATREVDEWELIKQGNIPMAIILAALILSIGIVIASVTRSG